MEGEEKNLRLMEGEVMEGKVEERADLGYYKDTLIQQTNGLYSDTIYGTEEED